MRIVAGKFRGRQLETPKGDDIRPTSDRVREAVFSIIGSRLGANLTGNRVLDLFAGTGALGIEAISRGADHCVFVDEGVEARGLIRHNIQEFGIAGQVKLLRRDATDLGSVLAFKPVDLVFIDPPYGQGLGEKALASAFKGGWFSDDVIVVFEEKANVELAIPEGLKITDRRDYGDTAITFIERDN